MTRAQLTDAEQFFYDNAGYSYGPDETPEQGRKRCARELADAEQWAQLVGAEFRWSDDWEITSHVGEFPDAYDHEPDTCEVCDLHVNGQWRQSLGCIDDATDDYRRVIEAELASEAMRTVGLEVFT